MHAAFLNLKNKENPNTKLKMSKSKGGFIQVQTLVDSGYDPIAYRYLCLQAHYRSELELAWEWLDADGKTGRADSLDTAAASLKRLYERIARAEKDNEESLSENSQFDAARIEVLNALNDDLNVPKAVGLLHTYASPRLWRAFDAVLGLDIENRAVLPEEEEAPAEIWKLVEARLEARKARDFARSDALRDEIAALGWEVADSPQGPTLKRKQ
jgi:cysteinyl-tRNA synthetase